jgi:hypothetical protein
MRARSMFICCGIALLPALCAGPTDRISPGARPRHFEAIVVDNHDDTAQRLLDPAFGVDPEANWNCGAAYTTSLL